MLFFLLIVMRHFKNYTKNNNSYCLYTYIYNKNANDFFYNIIDLKQTIIGAPAQNKDI